jgi:hypothetical protein
MAIARAGTGNGFNGPGQTTLTISVVNSGGSNQLLLVNGYVTGSSSAPSITYNGVALTVISSGDNASGSYNFAAYLIAPATGTNNLVLTAGGAGYNNITATIYSDIDQTTPYYGYGKFSSLGTNPESISASGTSVDDWFWMASSGQRDSTANTNLTVYGNGSGVDIYDSNGTIGVTTSRDYKIDITSGGPNYNYQYYLFLKKLSASASKIKSADGLLLANIKSADGVVNS